MGLRATAPGPGRKKRSPQQWMHAGSPVQQVTPMQAHRSIAAPGLAVLASAPAFSVRLLFFI